MKGIRTFSRAAQASCLLLLAAIATAPGVAHAQAQTIFNNGNIAAVENGPTQATVFQLTAQTTIVRVMTYHWNYGQGALPGTIAIRSTTGQFYGPWQAMGQPGQGGVPNAYWFIMPNVGLPPGVYMIVDSDPGTWSQNGGTGGAGIATIEGYFQ